MANLLGHLGPVNVVLVEVGKVVDPGALDDCNKRLERQLSRSPPKPRRIQPRELPPELTLHHHHPLVSEQHLGHDQRGAFKVGKVVGAPQRVRSLVTCA